MNQDTLQRQIVTVSDRELAVRCARGRVIIIDDDADFLDALVGLISLEGYAAESYPSAAAYLQVLNFNRPNFPGPSCILCDVRMPEVDGLVLQKKLAERNQAPMILMSGACGISEAVTAFRQGALDFLVKPIESDVLLAAINKALALSRELQSKYTREGGLAALYCALSQREQEVLRRVGAGQTNLEIASAIGISLRSVKRHRQSGMEKLGADSSAALIRMLAQIGQ